MTARIEISSRRYQAVYGCKPHGFGLWYFQLPGGRIFSFSGEYRRACRAATRHARTLLPHSSCLVQVSA